MSGGWHSVLAMARAYAAEMVARLVDGLPRGQEKVTARTIDTYIDYLASVPDRVLEAAVARILPTEDWFPSLALIRRTCAELVLDLPSEADALEQVDGRIRWTREKGSGSGTPAPPVHPIVQQALNQVGGYAAFRDADEPSVVRGQFGRIFRGVRAAAVLEAQTSPAIEPGPRTRALMPAAV